MKIKDEFIIKIYQGGELHYLIILLSIISSIIFALSAVVFVKKREKIKPQIIKCVNHTLYVISMICVVMMFLNPSIWYQYVFMNADGEFYLNYINILILLCNLIIVVILPYSFISQNYLYKLFSVFACPILLMQIINPSLFLLCDKVKNGFANNISIVGYTSFLILYFGSSVFHILHVILENQKTKKIKEIVSILILLIPIVIPYILFSRSPELVPRLPTGEIDLLCLNGGLTITTYSLSHIIFIALNVLWFLIYFFIIKYIIKKEYLYDALIIFTTGLIFTVICRRATYLFDNKIGLFVLPDSPCAIGVFIAYFGLILKNKTLINYSVFITLAFTTLNNIIMFQGDVGNFWHYFSMDSIFYHLYLSIIVFNMSRLNNFNVNKKSIFKCCLIYTSIYFIFTLLGNIQTRIEFLTGIDLSSKMYVGFFYDAPAFSFLYDFVHSFSYVGNGYEILLLNRYPQRRRQ